MRYQLLLIIVFLLYPVRKGFFHKSKEKIQLQVNSSEYDEINYSLYKAIVTGNSKGIPRQMKHKIKEYGFIHLLTPSGLHLSALIGIFRTQKIIQFIILGLILIFINMYDGYDSMTRVTIYRLLSFFVSHFKFPLTLLASISIGHYNSNPLSFIYSLLFWGTILIFKSNPIKMLFFLNFSMYFANSITGDLASPLSIIVNPFMTLLTTLFFPILIFNNFLPSTLQLSTLINFYFNSWNSILKFIIDIDHLPKLYFSPAYLILFLLVIEKHSKLLLAIIVFSFCSSPPQKVSRYLPSQLISINNLGDLLKIRTNRHYYENGTCLVEENRFYCKKKPHKK